MCRATVPDTYMSSFVPRAIHTSTTSRTSSISCNFDIKKAVIIAFILNSLKPQSENLIKFVLT